MIVLPKSHSEMISKMKDLNSSIEILYFQPEIITNQQKLFETALNLNFYNGDQIKVRQRVRIWMSGMRKDKINIFTANFNLKLWFRYLVSIFIICGIQNNPTLQIAVLLKIEIFSVIFFLNVRRQFKYSYIFLSIMLQSIGYTLFFIQSLPFTKQNYAYSRSLRMNPWINLLEFTVVCLLVSSYIMMILHGTNKYLDILKNRFDETKLGNFLDAQQQTFQKQSKITELSVPGNLQEDLNSEPEEEDSYLDQLTIPQYSIRSKALKRHS